MHPNVTDSVLEGFAAVEIGPAVSTFAGVSIAPLHQWAPTTVSDLMPVGMQSVASLELSDGLQELRWEELSPPNPSRVRARNEGPLPVVVRVGSVLSGGMSSRALTSPQVVNPEEEAHITVQVLGSRWWSEGPLVARGALSPFLTALLLQSVFGNPDASATARITLQMSELEWEPSHDLLSLQASGWVVKEGDRILAAWLDSPAARDFREPPSTAEQSHDDGEPSLITQIKQGLAQGSLGAHSWLQLEQSGHVVVLTTTTRIADKVADGLTHALHTVGAE